MTPSQIATIRLIELVRLIQCGTNVFSLRAVRLNALRNRVTVKIRFFIKRFLAAHAETGAGRFQPNGRQILASQASAVGAMVLGLAR